MNKAVSSIPFPQRRFQPQLIYEAKCRFVCSISWQRCVTNARHVRQGPPRKPSRCHLPTRDNDANGVPKDLVTAIVWDLCPRSTFVVEPYGIACFAYGRPLTQMPDREPKDLGLHLAAGGFPALTDHFSVFAAIRPADWPIRPSELAPWRHVLVLTDFYSTAPSKPLPTFCHAFKHPEFSRRFAPDDAAYPRL
jgi:hypothetical protein